MKILVSIVALAVALAWPSAGEAQSNQSNQGKKSTVRHKAAPQQHAQRPKAVANRAAGKLCAGYAWWGCTGWDPDPNVREMLARDVGQDP